MEVFYTIDVFADEVEWYFELLTLNELYEYIIKKDELYHVYEEETFIGVL